MIAYFDCFAGAAGDMILAALLDAGADLNRVRAEVDRLGLGVHLEVVRAERGGIAAAQLQIKGGEGLVMQGYAAGVDLLEGAGLEPPTARRALAILKRLAAAEASVHQVSLEEVHFHELGGADTLVDVVGVCAAIESLGVTTVASSPVATGWGLIESSHGLLPVPAPAVLELLEGAAIAGRAIAAELVTPTGAAILAECAVPFGPMPAIAVRATGLGAGTAILPFPNLVRVILGDPIPADAASGEVLVAATIDDMNPEIYPYLERQLRGAGASDCWIVPVIGKAGRPAQVVEVLCSPSFEERVREVLFTETSTLGVRSSPARKWALERRWVETEVMGQTVRVKVAMSGDRVLNAAPEHTDCVEAAARTGLALKEVYRLAMEAYSAGGA